MILAFDTYYSDDKAKTVCIAFENWTDSVAFQTYEETLKDIKIAGINIKFIPAYILII